MQLKPWLSIGFHGIILRRLYFEDASLECTSHLDLLSRFKGYCNEPYLKLHHRHKNGHCSVGTFVKFVWATMRRKFLNGNTSVKTEDIEL